MKNYIQSYTRNALFVLLCLAPALHATKSEEGLPVYKRTFSQLVMGQDDEQSVKHICLDDGSYWEVLGYLAGKDGDLKKWQEGDTIQVLWSPPKSKGVFWIGNSQRSGQPIVSLESKSLKFFPTIDEVHQDGSYVKLSDGTLWQFNWWARSATKNWEAGQHVMVQGKGKNNKYSLINLDMHEDSFFQSKFANGSFVKYEK